MYKIQKRNCIHDFKGTVYNGTQFLLYTLYHCPEGDPLESKHIATLNTQHLLVMFGNLFLFLKKLTQRDDKSAN